MNFVVTSEDACPTFYRRKYMTSVFHEKNYLWVVFGCITSLFILGAIALWDITPAVTHHLYVPDNGFQWLGIHIASFIAGMILLSLLMRVKICPVNRMVAWPLGIMGIIILALMLAAGVGADIYGTVRLHHKVFIRPFVHSVYVGPSVILMLIPLFVHLFDTIRICKGRTRLFYLLGAIALIVFVNLVFTSQSDVSASFLCNGIIALLFLKTGDTKKRAYIAAGAILAICAVYVYHEAWHPYWLHYGICPFCHYGENTHFSAISAFEVRHAMCDLKAGGLFGSGLGHYSRMEQTPYPHYFAWIRVTTLGFPPRITAREFGVVGVSLVFVLYGGLIYALFTQIKQVVDKQRRLLGYGLLLFLAIQAFFPLLRVILALPSPSYQMPFMGYGTQRMILSCITVGLILGIVRNRPVQEGVTPEKEGRNMGNKLLAFFRKQNKVTVCIAGVASLCAIVAIGYLLAYRHELMRGVAERLNIRREMIPPVRGDIFGRNMRPLVLHTQKPSLFVAGDGTADDELADKAARILRIKPRKIRDILRRRSPFSWVARKIDEDKAQQIREIDVNHRFKTRDEPVREYPLGKTFAVHLLGFTGIDNDGMEGLELLYNNALAGREAGMRYLFNNHRYEFPPKQQGNNLILNLDAELQGMLEQHIGNGLVEMKYPTIIAIVMDAERGEILASVVRPGRGKHRRNLRRYYPFSKIRNRAVTDVFEPGNDIMNLFINAAALEEGIINADGVAAATAAPEDVLGRLGEERLCNYLRAFGFGSKTGIDLPGEIYGIMQKPGIHPTDSQGPGYWMATTPLQLLSAFCAIANNGIVMIPHVVSKTVSPDNRVISTYPPHVRSHPLSGETADALLSIITKQSDVDGCDGIIPMVSGSAARHESHYAPGKITLFTLAFLGDKHKTGVLLVVDNPTDNEQAKNFSESVIRCIAPYGRDALHASPPASAASGASVSIDGCQAETKDNGRDALHAAKPHNKCPKNSQIK